MQKTLKRLFMLLLSVALISCIAVFAACNKDEETNDGTITITVKYPDGTPVNGHTDGTGYDESVNEPTADGSGTCVLIQICIAPNQGVSETCLDFFLLGADGKVTLNVQDDIISGFAYTEGFTDDTKFDIHVRKIDNYEGECTYTKNTLPSKLDITLVANS